jgi:hypothetical protein
MKAYVWASGLIEFGAKTPEGAIELFSANREWLRETVSSLAEKRGNRVLVCPGVVGDGRLADADAAKKFQRRIEHAWNSRFSIAWGAK